MTSTTYHNGRLCNQIFRNLAVSLIAEKHDLKVDYSNKDTIGRLGIGLFSGTRVFNNTIRLDDNNFFAIYTSDKLESNLDPNADYFQTNEVSNILYKYLRSDKVMASIIDKNPFKHRYNANNDVAIHIRLGDVAHHNPGLEYYLKALDTLSFDTIYIMTDDPNHHIPQSIVNKYQSAVINNYDEVNTLQFASTCKHVILSHGSFSASIGFLAFFSTVHYPEYNPAKIWYGDMFSIPGWVEHKCL